MRQDLIYIEIITNCIQSSSCEILVVRLTSVLRRHLVQRHLQMLEQSLNLFTPNGLPGIVVTRSKSDLNVCGNLCWLVHFLLEAKVYNVQIVLKFCIGGITNRQIERRTLLIRR